MSFPTSIRELSEGLQAGAFTSVDLTQHYLNVIAKKNPVINAFVDVYEAEARRLAEEVDAKRQAGESLGPLAGIPFGIKENMHYKGKTTTCCSKLLEGVCGAV